MNAVRAFTTLRSLGLPVLRPAEAAAVLGMPPTSAAQTLRRLSLAGLIQPLRHGSFWMSSEPIDPWVALPFVAAPYPAYASLYSALYLRGALSQIPVVHYAVSLGRTRRVRTTAGTFSLHQVVPALFSGFEELASGARIATVEKALFDLAYLAPTRSRLFAKPPELEIPRRLHRNNLEAWLAAIPSAKRQLHTRTRLSELLKQH